MPSKSFYPGISKQLVVLSFITITIVAYKYFRKSSSSTELTDASAYSVKDHPETNSLNSVARNINSGYASVMSGIESPLLPPDKGPGGPVLVVNSPSNQFSTYYAEILRAEGLNEFGVEDISSVSSAMLNRYDVVLIGEMNINARYAAMLADWVKAGGTLITFKPPSTMMRLLGLTATGGMLSNKYLLVDTKTPSGMGVTDQTMQFHGDAGFYELNGAASLATIYSSATEATPYPAITMMNVGTKGGRAIAFAYDLARSVVYTRQGNPAWAGQKRDGQINPIRSDDLFFPDWLDFEKIAIPQADEQQRLLVNIILQSNLHRKPLPRFWYLPRDLKAAIVMTGDNHTTGTTGRFYQYLTLGNNSAQDVADWKAVRATSYIYPDRPISDEQAKFFEERGFEIALHTNTGCVDYTPFSLQKDFKDQLSRFANSYPDVSIPVTNRSHCLNWSDWSSTPKVELQNGIRLDATYYYWPEAWMQNRPGMFTGSGLPMRFADIDGSLIDVYQMPTQMTDETNMDYSSFCNTVLDRALGPEGYYGVFCANMHTDNKSSPGSDAIIASAQARQIPVISARQMLSWLDGRNNSSFDNIAWKKNQLTFSISRASGANNLRAMLPLYSQSGELSSITSNGNPVPFTIQSIKGMDYAFFAATSGTAMYTASYSNEKRSNLKRVQKLTDITKDTVSTGALYVNITPNPGLSYFNVVLNSGHKEPATVRVSDRFGRMLESYEQIAPSGILRIGQKWKSGTYFVAVVQGNERKVTRVMKVN